MTIVARLFVAESEERRYSQRRTVAADATLRSGRTVPHDVVVQDLSVSGCQFVSSDAFADGVTVSIGIAGLGVHQAQIVRRSGRLHGCEFLRPLTEEQVALAGQGDTVLRDVFSSIDDLSGAEPVIVPFSGAARIAIVTVAAVAAWIPLGFVAAAIW